MSPFFRDYAAALRPRSDPFESRSMGNNLRLGQKVIVPLLCPRSPGLGSRSLRASLIADSLVKSKLKNAVVLVGHSDHFPSF
jgi:hypothetical protein